MSLYLQARIRDSAQNWNTAPSWLARSRESGFRTAARKLGLRGRILTVVRVGSSQWEVNVDGKVMMVVESRVRPVCIARDADDVVPGRTCGRPLPCREHGGSAP